MRRASSVSCSALSRDSLLICLRQTLNRVCGRRGRHLRGRKIIVIAEGEDRLVLAA